MTITTVTSRELNQEVARASTTTLSITPECAS